MLITSDGNVRNQFISLSVLQAEELDLPEILKKKEEIAETRNALFQEISQEKKQYVCLAVFKDLSHSQKILSFDY